MMIFEDGNMGRGVNGVKVVVYFFFFVYFVVYKTCLLTCLKSHIYIKRSM